jgi:hypothetical protein
MARDPAPPPPPDQPRSGAGEAPGGESGREHFGIVSIARHVKDDGRSLILYTRDGSARNE